MGVDYSDVVDLAADLHAVPGRIEPLAKIVSKKTGYDAGANAQANVAVDTGFLKSTIAVDHDSDGLGWTLYTTADYGAHVEYGTSGPYPIPNAFGRGGFVMHPGVSPQPYIGPAFDGQVVSAENAIGQAAMQVLR